MECVRSLTIEDLPAVKFLWQERFADPEPFVDWFFRERFYAEASAGLFVDNMLVSAIQGCPMELLIRGVPVKAVMVSGVSTKVGFERRGYMHRVMEQVVRHAREQGAAIVFHRPEHFETYASLSQLPATTAQFVTAHGGGNRGFEQEPDASALLCCYQRVGQRYSGFVLRNEAEFLRKLGDYAASGGRILTLREGTHVRGYAVVLADGTAPEVIAEDTETYRALFAGIPKGTRAKLPPDVPLGGELLPGNAMGAAKVETLLRTFVGDPAVTIRILDPLLRENCGIWNGLGERVSKTPDFACSSGEFVQGVVGYREMPGLFTPCTCYGVDEY